MKAVILAAGKGSRLQLRTTTTPKPMLDFHGKPILEYNINLCRAHGITELFINTHHLANVITDYFGDGKKFGLSIIYSFEPELLGTAGALNNFKHHLSNKPFFVLYGDNISQFNLTEFQNHHLAAKALATIACHYREDVSASGVVECDPSGRIVKFLEKPAPGLTSSHWVNAGIYCLSPNVFNFIPNGFSDFGKDIFPQLLANNQSIHAICEHEKVLAFDTEAMFQNAQGLP